jgi:hypothetical protein
MTRRSSRSHTPHGLLAQSEIERAERTRHDDSRSERIFFAANLKIANDQVQVLADPVGGAPHWQVVRKDEEPANETAATVGSTLSRFACPGRVSN